MILLTGSAGFIGGNVLRKLNILNIFDVIVVDEIKDTGKWQLLNGCQFVEYV